MQFDEPATAVEAPGQPLQSFVAVAAALLSRVWYVLTRHCVQLVVGPGLTSFVWRKPSRQAQLAEP